MGINAINIFVLMLIEIIPFKLIRHCTSVKLLKLLIYELFVFILYEKNFKVNRNKANFDKYLCYSTDYDSLIKIFV